MVHSSCVRNNGRGDLWVYAKDGKNGERLQIVSLMNISEVLYVGIYHIIWATDHNGSAVPPESNSRYTATVGETNVSSADPWSSSPPCRPVYVTTNHETFESFVQFSQCMWMTIRWTFVLIFWYSIYLLLIKSELILMFSRSDLSISINDLFTWI